MARGGVLTEFKTARTRRMADRSPGSEGIAMAHGPIGPRPPHWLRQCGVTDREVAHAQPLRRGERSEVWRLDMIDGSTSIAKHGIGDMAVELDNYLDIL